MLTFTKEVPEWAHVCDWTKENAEGYFEVQHFGRKYFVPVTKEMRRLFGITRRGNKIAFKCNDMDVEKFLRDIVASVLTQVRHAVGDEIHADLNQQLNTFLNDTLEPHFERMIQGKMNQRLLPEDTDEIPM